MIGTSAKHDIVKQKHKQKHGTEAVEQGFYGTFEAVELAQQPQCLLQVLCVVAAVGCREHVSFSVFWTLPSHLGRLSSTGK